MYRYCVICGDWVVGYYSTYADACVAMETFGGYIVEFNNNDDEKYDW